MNTVIVSSTARDLAIHRDTARDSILRRGMTPLMMEYLEASPRDAIDESFRLVDEGDVYLLILAHRYGYRPKDPRNPDNLSITEMEYNRAVEKNKPIVCFIMGEDHPITAKMMETEDDAPKRLAALKDRIGKKFVVNFFDSPQELDTKIFHALTSLKERGLLKGGGSDTLTPPADAPLLPIPPAPYIVHKPTEARHFVGRAAEFKVMDDWAESTDTTLVLKAIGGEGKTSLAWHWTTQNSANFEGVIWWSFYETDSGTNEFVRYALAYLTGKTHEALKGLSESERSRDLLQLLSSKRILLVFDGFERLLAGYQNMKFSQALDEDVNDDKDNRAFTDPRHTEFFQKLTQSTPSKIIITTRLLPIAFQDKSHALLLGIQEYSLRGLNPDDALALLRDVGITGDERAIKNFTQKFDNHSLVLGVIAGRIRNYRKAPYNFDVWEQDEGRALQLDSVELTQRNTHILQYALQGLNNDHELSRLLGQCSAFRYYPLSYAKIVGVNPYLKRTRDKRKAETQLDKGLTELESRGLVQRDTTANTYNIHPVIRAVVLDEKTTPKITQKTYFGSVERYFRSLRAEKLDGVTEIHQLERSIEIYTALVRAGQFNSASDFYEEHLQVILLNQLAAYVAIVELLTPLFSDPQKLSPAGRQSVRMTDLGNAFYYLGQTDKTLKIREADLKFDLDQQDANDLAVDLRNYGATLRDLNQRARTEAVWGLALSLALAAKDANNIALSHVYLHLATAERGAWELEDGHYRAFMTQPPTHQAEFWTGNVERHQAEALLTLGRLTEGESTLKRAWDLAVKSQNALGQRVIWYLRGEFALRHRQTAVALAHFNEVVRLTRAISSSDVVVALGGLARALLADNKPDEARKIVENDLQDNKYGEAIDAAEVYLGLGERDKAKEHALKAYKFGWADGPPYINWYMLERAKKVLDALGEPYPDLPPYDPSKQEPIPYEAEIRAFIAELKARRR